MKTKYLSSSMILTLLMVLVMLVDLTSSSSLSYNKQLSTVTLYYSPNHQQPSSFS